MEDCISGVVTEVALSLRRRFHFIALAVVKDGQH